MKVNKILILLTALVFTLGVAGAGAEEPTWTKIVDLFAGGGNPKSTVDVGNVFVGNDADNLYVKYQIEDATPSERRDNWYLTATHLDFGTSLADIPQVKGNPVPGLFDYQAVHEPGTTDYLYTIPLAEVGASVTDLYIAAHADVKIYGGLTGLELALPETVTMGVKYPYSGGPAYFPEVYVSNDGFLNGTYLGWCTDQDRTIGQYPTTYTAKVYSSYEQLPKTSATENIVEHPENLDLVNWILNQDYVGKLAYDSLGNSLGIVTYGDVQRSIWELIDDSPYISPGSYSQSRVNEIKNAAFTLGDEFEPTCEEYVGVFLLPQTITTYAQAILAQATLAQLQIPCYDRSETAWAGIGTYDVNGSLVALEKKFPGKNWGLYFTYTLVDYSVSVSMLDDDAILY